MALLASPKYQFKDALIHAAPDDPGVYALYFGDDLLYIGAARGWNSADTIRSHLLAHVRGEAKPSMATHYKWELHRNPDMRLTEILAMLEPKMPPYNRPQAEGDERAGN